MSDIEPDTPTPYNPNTKASTGLAMAIILVALTSIIGVVILVLAGKDTDKFVEFAVFLIPMLIMQIWTASRVNVVQQQVNGKLTARLVNLATDIKEHISATSVITPPDVKQTTPESIDAGINR